MTHVHLIQLYVVDPDRLPKSQIANALLRVGDLYPTVVSHEIKAIPWGEEDALMHHDMSPHEFLRWFHAYRPETMTIQTVVSTIRLAPHDVPGRAWLMKNVVPLLNQGHLTTAQSRIMRQPFGTPGDGQRPVLMRLVFELVSEILHAQEAAQRQKASRAEDMLEEDALDEAPLCGSAD